MAIVNLNKNGRTKRLQLLGSVGITQPIDLNIAYGDTAPEDTSMLWVKAEKPSNLIISSVSLPEENEIASSGLTLSSARYGVAAVAVGAKIYLFGGYTGSAYLNTIQVFDTVTGTLSTLSATLAKGAYGVAAAAVGTKIYLFGGCTGSSTYSNTIQVFDTVTGTRTTLSKTLSSSRHSMGAAAVGTKVYLFGGGNSGYLSTIQVFDTVSNTITTLSATLAKGAYGVAAVAIGASIYVFGGYYYSGEGYYVDIIQVFDTSNNTITTLSATLPEGNSSVAAVAIGASIYLFGGIPGSYSAKINVFDVSSETVTTLATTLPIGAGKIGAAAVGTKIYLFGGQKSYGQINSINVFTVITQLASGTLYLKGTYTGNTFSLMRTDYTTVEVGVGAAYLGNADGIAELVPAALHDGEQWVEI